MSPVPGECITGRSEVIAVSERSERTISSVPRECITERSEVIA
jgi:hypothetical protein